MLEENIQDDLVQPPTFGKDISFIERLTRYYSDFLETDFKKGSLPKRRFLTRDKRGRRAGIPLEKFSSFQPTLKKILANEFGSNNAFEIKPGVHLAQLSAITLAAIESEIDKVEIDELASRNLSSISKFKERVVKRDIDLEVEVQQLVKDLERNVGIVIGAPLASRLTPIFQKSASNLADALSSVDDDVAELLVTPIADSLPSVVGRLLSESDDSALQLLIDEAFDENKVKSDLRNYFDSFSAGDLSTEIRELMTVERLDENLEFYLYIGEIRYQSYEFPIFYIPLNIEKQGVSSRISIEPRLLINKKAVDYVARLLQDQTNTKSASAVSQRIVYVSPTDSIYKLVAENFDPILMAFQMPGQLQFNGPTTRLKNASVSVTNSLRMALFDKSDESMLTDYEELLHELGNSSGELLSFVENLVGRFLNDNPVSIKNEILDDWEHSKISDRLVFDSPIPLAEEQRKILNAIKRDDGKFISVEGPPGTGKSHTISAIAFEAILTGKSVLVLSDKNEALDVVQAKLNETLSRVRPSEAFINPILRLGKVGTNFKKIVSSTSIENLRTQSRELKSQKKQLEKQYEESVSALKTNISARVEQGRSVDVGRILTHERSLNSFKDFHKDNIDGLEEALDSGPDAYERELRAIQLLLDTRDKVRGFSDEFIDFAAEFGDDAESLSSALKFSTFIKERASELNIFRDAPGVTSEHISKFEPWAKEVQDAKGVFGYLFSGKKLASIRDSIKSSIGLELSSNNANEMVSELLSFKEKLQSFYRQVREQTFVLSDELIKKSLALSSVPDVDIQLPSQLISLQKAVNIGDLPFLGDDETIIQILTLEDSSEADFYREFLDLKIESSELKETLEEPRYAYAEAKKDIENFNVLRLAAEIDERVIDFADNYRNDAKTLAQIISQKKKFPRDKFAILKQAFPCMICSLRDYAEYIPLERELFDLVIIDEASQVTIAQAFPAIIRARKLVVLGDKRQFGNVKTTNASKEYNTSYFEAVKKALATEAGGMTSSLDIRASKLNISNSILEFMENLSNFDVMLKKHFRGYPEMISFSSKFFYQGALQAMKIRGKPIDDVLEFVHVEYDGKIDRHRNSNRQEVELILERVLEQIDTNDLRSVAVITPHREQQTLVSKVFSEHERFDEILEKLNFRSFTFDTCQGEERDIIYYSFVATPDRDHLWGVLPKTMEAHSEEELDSKLKLQRMNVAFSRGKEKLVFVISKPISDFSAGREVLQHYANQIKNAKKTPSYDDVDVNSQAEKRVLDWIQQTQAYLSHQPEIQPQFAIGDYLASVDPNYKHPKYRVDFLLRFTIDKKNIDLIIEYDGFEYHFDDLDQVDAGNWKHYQKSSDIEREHVLESYGYKTIRLNKFNVGSDPVSVLNEKIEDSLAQMQASGDGLLKPFMEGARRAHVGRQNGDYRVCRKCNQHKPKDDFFNPELKSLYYAYCSECRKKPRRKKVVRR